jgi:hypothetical protein
MPMTIDTGRNHEFPASILPVDDDLVLIGDGINAVKQWNGKDSAVTTAGVEGPETALVLADGGAGAITTTNAVAYCRFVKPGGGGEIYSDLSPVSNALTLSSRQIAYSGIPVSTDPYVTKRQIFRTLSGGGATVYLDVEITNLTTTTATSNNTDGAISLLEAIVIQDEDGTDLYNVNGVPPDYKTVFTNHLGRVLAVGEAIYKTGHVQVANGSTAVVGIGTNWTQAMAGRYLYVVGGLKPYLIASVGSASGGRQTLTLGENYTGPSTVFGQYAIRPDPIYKRTIHPSEPFKPQSFDVTNALAIQETGDEITTVISQGAYAYIVEQKHIHRLAYDVSPTVDGAVFLMVRRGCVNDRSWTIVGEMLYMLDEQGVHRYDGNRQAEQVSAAIQDLWRTDGSGFRINWRANRWFHCSHYPAQEVIRWWVALSGNRYPRHAIAYHHGIDRWWIEEYRYPICSSVQARLSLPRVLVGTRDQLVLGIDVGPLDGVDPTRVPRSRVTSATLMSLTDTLANFESDVVGCPVAIVQGTGKGQIRDIVSHTSTRLNLRNPWRTLPDTTSVYQVGGFQWQWSTGQMRWAGGEDNVRYLEAIYDPLVYENRISLELFNDFVSTPLTWRSSRNDQGLVVERGATSIDVDMTYPLGRVTQRLEDGQDRYAEGYRFVKLRMSGFAGVEKVTVHEINIAGAE